MQYDLLVLGSDPAGQEAARAAAQMNKRVALVEHERRTVAGLCLHAATIPTGTIREAILQCLKGAQSRSVAAGGPQPPSGRCPPPGFAGLSTPDPSPPIMMNNLRSTLQQRNRQQWDALHAQLNRNGVDVLAGEAHFLGPHEVQVTHPDGESVLLAEYILVGCGTWPNRPAHIPFDGERVFDSDDILSLETIPQSMIVVGGGVIGIEYAVLFAEFGVRLTVVDGREGSVQLCDAGVSDALIDHARSVGVAFRFGEDVIGVERTTDGRVAVRLESGSRVTAETVLYTAGRVGNTDQLNLPAVGIEPDERGRLWCNENLQTWVPHIYAVGDVVGYPPSVRHSTRQGHRVVEHAFGRAFDPVASFSRGSTAQHAAPSLQLL